MLLKPGFCQSYIVQDSSVQAVLRRCSKDIQSCATSLPRENQKRIRSTKSLLVETLQGIMQA